MTNKMEQSKCQEHLSSNSIGYSPYNPTCHHRQCMECLMVQVVALKPFTKDSRIVCQNKGCEETIDVRFLAKFTKNQLSIGNLDVDEDYEMNSRLVKLVKVVDPYECKMIEYREVIFDEDQADDEEEEEYWGNCQCKKCVSFPKTTFTWNNVWKTESFSVKENMTNSQPSNKRRVFVLEEGENPIQTKLQKNN